MLGIGKCEIKVTAFSDNITYETKSIEVSYDQGKSYQPSESAIVEDNATGIDYVNNIIIIYVDFETTDERVDEIAKSIDGKVVGMIRTLAQYQIMIEPRTLEELEELAEKLESDYDDISFATYDTIFVVEKLQGIAVAPNDPWASSGTITQDVIDDWLDDDIDGNNWWAEAINLQYAWGYNDYFYNVDRYKMDIGVCDSMFNTSNIEFDRNRFNIVLPKNSSQTARNTENLDSDSLNHGTSVAGIICAAENGRGITGAAQQSDLLVAPILINGSTSLSSSQIDENFSSLVLLGADVINFSLGASNKESDYNNWSNEKKYVKQRDNYAKNAGNEAAKATAVLLEQGFDFVVVQGAGNGLNNERGYSVDRGVDTKYNGRWCSITSDSKTHSKEISINDVLDRVIVVAATYMPDGNGKYVLCNFSNFGTNVSIAAPGSNIFCPQYTGYDSVSGTSFAAPMVTGVASLVWSVNPEFSGADVKRIVCDSSPTETIKGRYSSDKYKFLDARAAVELAIEKTKVYRVKSTFTLEVYNRDNELSNDYYYQICCASQEETSIIGKVSTSQSPVFTLNKGTYQIDLVNLYAYILKDYETVKIIIDDENGEDTLKLYTNFYHNDKDKKKQDSINSSIENASRFTVLVLDTTGTYTITPSYGSTVTVSFAFRYS